MSEILKMIGKIMNESLTNHQKFITDSLDTPKVQWINIIAKFDSICVECNGIINQGEFILWDKKKCAKHETCPAISDNDSTNDFTNDNNGISVISNDNDIPKGWIDPKKYSYKELLHMNNCQYCGADVSDKSKRYIDDDRLVCVNHFG